MLDYRLYLVGSAGQVEGVRELKAENDTAAINAAAMSEGVRRMELWCGARVVEDWSLVKPEQAIQALPSQS